MSETQKNIEPTNQDETKLGESHKKKGYRRVLYLLGFLLIVQIIFYFFSTPILRTTVSRAVYNGSDSLYKADFEKIIVNVLRGDFILQNFSVQADSLRYEKLKQQGKVKTALYDIQFKQFKLSHLNIWKFFFKDEIKVKLIEIESPQIKLLNLPDTTEQKKERYDAVHRDLYPILAQYARTISIQKIKIPNGKFDLYVREQDRSRSSNIDKLSIELSQFKLDEKIYVVNTKLFYSDDIDIKINHFSQNMADGIHRLSASNIHISTKSGNMSADNLVLAPKNIISKAQLDTTPTFSVTVPSILIKDADIARAYFKKEIAVNKVSLLEPNIYIQKNKLEKQNVNDSVETVKKSKLDLYKLIKGNIKQINIDSFWVYRGNFELHRLPKTGQPMYDIDDLSVTLYGFDLDSVAFLNKTKIFFSKDIEISMKNFNMQLPDKRHVVQVSQVNLSTLNRHIFAQNIRMHPIYKHREEQLGSFFNLKVPSIEVTGIDLRRAFNQMEIPIKRLKLDRPVIDLKIYKESFQRKKQARTDSLLLFFNMLHVDKFNLNKADIIVEQYQNDSLQGYVSTQGDLNLYQLHIDKQTLNKPNQFFYANYIDMGLNNFRFKSPNKLNELNMSVLLLSTKDNFLKINGFKFLPSRDSLLYSEIITYGKPSEISITFDELQMDSFDIKKAFFERKIIAHEIKLANLDFGIKSYKTGKKKKKTKKLYLSQPEKQDPYFHSAVLQIIDSLQHLAGIPMQKKQDTLRFRKMYLKTMDKLAGQVNLIDLDRVLLRNNKIKFETFDTLDNPIARTEFGLQMWTDKVFMEPDSATSDDQILVMDNIQWAMQNFISHKYKNHYSIKAKNIEYSNLDHLLSIYYLRVVSEEKNKKESNKQFVELFIPKIQIEKPDLMNLVLNHKFKTNKISIIDPSIFLLNHRDTITRPLKPRFLPEMLTIPFNIQTAEISEIDISDGKMGTKKYSYSSDKWANSLFFNLNIKDLQTSQSDSDLVLHFAPPEMDFSDIKVDFSDKIHRVDIPKVVYDKENDAFFIEQINISATDSTRYDMMAKAGKKASFDFHIRNATLRKPDWAKLLFERYVSSNSLSIRNMDVDFYRLKIDSIPSGNADEINFYEPISKSLMGVAIDTIDVSAMNLQVKEHNKPETFQLDSAQVSATGFIVDSVQYFNKERLYYTDNFHIEVPNITHLSKDSVFELSFKKVVYTHNPRIVDIQNISYKPLLDDYEIAKHYGKQKTGLWLKVPEVKIYNFDTRSYIRNQDIIVQYIKAESPYLNTFTDKRTYEAEPLENSPLLQEMLAKYPHKINIDSIRISHFLYHYREHRKDYAKQAFLSLNDFDILARNVCNAPELSRKPIRLSASGYLMNNGPIRVSLKAPVQSEHGNHLIAGSMDTMDLTTLNPLLENMLSAHVKKGRIVNARFSAHFNDTTAEGRIRLRYNGLRVSLMKQSKKDSSFNTRGLFSFLANRFLPKRNPKPGRLLKEGEIFHKRLEDHSIFHFWIMGVISGIRSTVGFETDDQKKHTKHKFKLLKIEEKKVRIENRRKRRYEREKRKALDKEEELEQKVLKQIEKNRNKQERKEQRDREKWQKSMIKQETQEIKNPGNPKG